jgi:DNA-binding LacI/PurR family transcriptional regulator
MASPPRKISIHDQLVALLREGILGSRWQGTLPAEAELCREFQVSRMTLRKALAQLATEHWIIPGGRGKHHRIKRKPVKREIATAHTIRILSPFKTVFGTTEQVLHETLTEILGTSGFRLVQEHHPRLFESFSASKLAQLDDQPDTAGWILFYATEQIQRWFAAHRRPVAVAGRVHDSLPLASVYPDSVALARHAAGLLHSKGYRDVVYLIANLTSLSDHLASEAFVAEARRLGSRARIVNYEASSESAAKAVRELIAAKPRPNGFVIGASEIAITVLCHLQAAGIRVPAEASVISTWDHDHFDYTFPTITRYHTDGAMFGRQLGRIMLDLIRHGTGKIRSVPIMPEYVPGGSVGNLRSS